MRLKPEQLTQHLSKELKPLYIVSGDEPLITQEICDQIRKQAKAQGFDEREVHQVEHHFKWGELAEAANALSLFSSRKLIEIRIDNGKPGDQGSKALMALFENPSPDNIFILILPRLEKPQQNSKWFKTIEKVGAFIAHWPIERNQLPGWIANRLRAANIKADRDALALLADRTDGNLLAAAQEIEKLKILGLTEISAQHIEDSVGDASRYDVFALSEAILKGECARSLHVLNVLQAEGINPLQLLAILANDVRQLMSFMQLCNNGLSDDKALQQLKVFWPKKQTQIKTAARRLSVGSVEESLQLCKQIDLATKNIQADNPWSLLVHLASKLCGLNILPIKA